MMWMDGAHRRARVRLPILELTRRTRHPLPQGKVDARRSEPSSARAPAASSAAPTEGTTTAMGGAAGSGLQPRCWRTWRLGSGQIAVRCVRYQSRRSTLQTSLKGRRTDTSLSALHSWLLSRDGARSLIDGRRSTDGADGRGMLGTPAPALVSAAGAAWGACRSTCSGPERARLLGRVAGAAGDDPLPAGEVPLVTNPR